MGKDMTKWVDDIIKRISLDSSVPLTTQEQLNSWLDTPGIDRESLAETVAQAYEQGTCATWLADAIAHWMLQHEEPQSRQHAYKLLARLAGAGSNAARVNLAIAKIRGEITPQDLKGVNDLCDQVLATTKTDLRLRRFALTILADSAREGRAQSVDHEKALALYVEAAHMGEINAAYTAGLYYAGKIKGYGQKARIDTAAIYYAIAADGGDMRAQTNLGILHYAGALAKSDIALGKRLLTRCIANGDKVASDVMEQIDRIRGVSL